LATIGLITICKGRLAQLRETLPGMIGQRADELIVVDFNCPDGTGDWVETRFPQLRCIRSLDAGPFSAAKARNLGAANATSDWLCFVDADIVLAPDFLNFVRSRLAPRRYFRPPPSTGLWNPVICRRLDWAGIGGFDEVIANWGCEDDDLFRRLELRHVLPLWLPEIAASELPYDKALRSRFHETDYVVSHRVNTLYVQMKLDLMRLVADELDLPTRMALYREACRAVSPHGDSAQISAALPSGSDLPVSSNWVLERRMTVTLRRSRPGADESTP
jgi:glycosyltransferase involved in cell wall biosynthesis